ncbi:hypothetical protein GOV09_01900 [Candidatus Woesearchaeota archaeon]|nr:hypothetical protein [Candidatus Woesearchaeota archaeon]
MGCYIFPTAAAIIHFFLRKKFPKLRTKDHSMLNTLFLGAAIFGVVDHAWNRELFLFNWFDLALGVVITLSILAVWRLIVLREQMHKVPVKN